MSCIQITPCQLQPGICISKKYQSSRPPAKFCFVQIHSINCARTSLKLAALVSKSSQKSPVLKYNQRAPVCLFCGQGKSEDGTEGPPSESLQKNIENSKKSIEDVLREQIEKQEYAVEPYLVKGGNPPHGGGGGGGRDRSGGSEDDFNEALQVILATISFILLYLTTIHGEDMILLARDYIRYLCTGNRTFRLRKTMEWWEQRWPRSRNRMAQRRVEDDDNDENGDADEDDNEDPAGAAIDHGSD